MTVCAVIAAKKADLFRLVTHILSKSLELAGEKVRSEAAGALSSRRLVALLRTTCRA